MPVPATVVLTSEKTADGEIRARLNASSSCFRCLLIRFSFNLSENSDIFFLSSCQSEAENRDCSDASWSTLGTSIARPARRTAVRGTIMTERIQNTRRDRNDVED